jgi:RNA recognition motif-containing protein
VKIATTLSQKSKGYGFVEFENQKDAKQAVVALNKQEFGGRIINVELARSQETK